MSYVRPVDPAQHLTDTATGIASVVDWAGVERHRFFEDATMPSAPLPSAKARIPDLEAEAAARWRRVVAGPEVALHDADAWCSVDWDPVRWEAKYGPLPSYERPVHRSVVENAFWTVGTVVWIYLLYKAGGR